MKIELVREVEVDPLEHPMHADKRMAYVLRDGLLLQFSYSLGDAPPVFTLHDRSVGKRYDFLITRDDPLPPKKVIAETKMEISEKAPPAAQVRPTPPPSPSPTKAPTPPPAPQQVPSRGSFAPPPAPSAPAASQTPPSPPRFKIPGAK